MTIEQRSELMHDLGYIDGVLIGLSDSSNVTDYQREAIYHARKAMEKVIAASKMHSNLSQEPEMEKSARIQLRQHETPELSSTNRSHGMRPCSNGESGLRT